MVIHDTPKSCATNSPKPNFHNDGSSNGGLDAASTVYTIVHGAACRLSLCVLLFYVGNCLSFAGYVDRLVKCPGSDGSMTVRAAGKLIC